MTVKIKIMNRICRVIFIILFPSFCISCENEGKTQDIKANIIWENTSKSYYKTSGIVLDKITDNSYIIGGYCQTDLNDDDWDCWFIKIDNSGNTTWEKSYGSKTRDIVNDLVVTDDGGCVFVGSGSFDDATVNSIFDARGLIGKLDTNGEIDWYKSYEDRAFRYIIINNIGEYIVCSLYSSPDDTYGNYPKKYFMKFSADGELIWEKVVEKEDINIHDVVYRLIQNNNGDYIACGLRLYDNSKTDCFILCFDDSGNFKWEKTYGGFKDELFEDIKQTSDGGYIAVGHTDSKDGDIKSGIKEIADAWIVKLDSLGSIEWEKTFGGTNQDYFIKVIVDSDDNYIVGYTSTSNDFDFSSTSQYKSGLLKINNENKVLWRKNIDVEDSRQMRSFIKSSDNAFIVLHSIVDSYYNQYWSWVLKIN